MDTIFETRLARTNKERPLLNAWITIECPLYIQTGILNVPQGWSPAVAPGAAQINFQEVVLSKQNARVDVGCFYSNQTGAFSFHSLHRTVPTNYVCKVEKLSETKFERTVSCTFRISTKKN
jgi:hypothetical protein